MELQQRVGEHTRRQSIEAKVFDGYFTTESAGYDHEVPIVHLCGRSADNERVEIPVEGFTPYFCVPTDDIDVQALQELSNDDRVCDLVTVDDNGDPIVDWANRELTRIETKLPKHVRELRDTFDVHYEADVRFYERFQIDNGYQQCVRVPDVNGKVQVSHVEPADDAVGDIDPRIGYLDIEVLQTDEGPSVVSETGTEEARNPITALTYYDSHTEKYGVWVLANPEWDTLDHEGLMHIGDERDDVAFVQTYADDADLLDSFVSMLKDNTPDILTGWNSNNFDIPYIVNRCFEVGVYDIKDCSPTGDVFSMSGDGNWLNSDWKGIVMLDMLDAFEKVSIHELDSYSLSNVADQQFDDIDKLDVDEQWAWVNDPARFVRYNIIDTELVVRINNETTDGEGRIV